MCFIAHKILVAMVTTFENTSLAMAKLIFIKQNFQLQDCLKLNFKQFCNCKFCPNIASLAVAKEVFSKVVTIATKILWAIKQIIASLHVKYLYNQISSIEDMQSADLVVFALNVLYKTDALHSGMK